MRSLDQLAITVSEIQKQIYREDFDSDEFQKSIQTFLSGLRIEDLEPLIRKLLDLRKRIEGADSWLGQVALQFGKLDPTKGFALAKELKAVP